MLSADPSNPCWIIQDGRVVRSVLTVFNATNCCVPSGMCETLDWATASGSYPDTRVLLVDGPLDTGGFDFPLTLDPDLVHGVTRYMKSLVQVMLDPVPVNQFLLVIFDYGTASGYENWVQIFQGDELLTWTDISAGTTVGGLKVDDGGSGSSEYCIHRHAILIEGDGVTPIILFLRPVWHDQPLYFYKVLWEVF